MMVKRVDTVGVYSILDRVAEDFGPLLEARTDGDAVRKMRMLSKKEGFRPEDYKLFFIGEVERSQVRIQLHGVDMREVIWREDA